MKKHGIDSPKVRESILLGVLKVLSEENIEKSIDQILKVIKRATRLDAVGIRLRHGDDYPFYAHNGFSHDFLMAENSLIMRNRDGSVCLNKDGTICLECTCGVVLSGKTDPKDPLFTRGGSAWTNNSLPFLDVPAEQDSRLNPRNRCVHDGYMSIAIIPIRRDKDIVGLLQLNDKRQDCFTLEFVHFLETLAQGIGIALIRIRDQSALKEAEKRLREKNAKLQSYLDELHALRGLIPICARCKKIRDTAGYWHAVEKYIVKHPDSDFSHSYCPDCYEKALSELKLMKRKTRNKPNSRVASRRA